MNVPPFLALSIYGLQLIITVPVLFFLRAARDRSLLEFHAPRFSLGGTALVFLFFAIAIVPLIVLNIWLGVALASAAFLLVTLALGFWFGS